MQHPFSSHSESLEWLDEQFSDTDKQILFIVIDAFDGIISETEDADWHLLSYKEMDLEAIPVIFAGVGVRSGRDRPPRING